MKLLYWDQPINKWKKIILKLSSCNSLYNTETFNTEELPFYVHEKMSRSYLIFIYFIDWRIFLLIQSKLIAEDKEICLTTIAISEMS